MYDMLTINSQHAYPREVFTEYYQHAAEVMTLISMDFEIRSALQQGTSAQVAYDVTFHTQLLGDFTDAERTLYLRAGDNGWQVVWSPSTIFFEMAGGGTLVLERQAPARANIYDREGRVIADQNGIAVTVSLIPENIPDETVCLNELSRILQHPVAEIRARYEDKPSNWLIPIDEIDADTYQAEADILTTYCDAVFSERRVRRYYGGGVASHVVGWVGAIPSEEQAEWLARGYQRGDLIGISGIEAWGESILAGSFGGRLIVVSPSGAVLRVIAERDAEPSQSIYLTIDRALQLQVQQALSDAYNMSTDTWARTSNGAAAIVMDVHTGEILAMASYPWFDPNIFNPSSPNLDQVNYLMNEDPRMPMLNRATLGEYPPGSVFKIVSMSAVADSGIYELDHVYVCTGIWLGLGPNNPKYDWLPGGHGPLTLPEALVHSCDPYFYQVGFDIFQSDPWILPEYAHRFGLGEPTGLEQIIEGAGLIPDPDWVRQTQDREWAPADSVHMAIGQGAVTVTPIQVARMVAAVANGGTLYQPQIVHHIGIIGEEPSWVFTPNPQRQVDIDPEVLDAVREAMCQVTGPEGTASWPFRDMSIPTCGKTGTAEAPGATSMPHAWFVAFAPADDPEIAVVVVVENSHEGSVVAAPIVRRIIEYYYDQELFPYPTEWREGLAPITPGEPLGD